MMTHDNDDGLWTLTDCNSSHEVHPISHGVDCSYLDYVDVVTNAVIFSDVLFL